MSTRIEIDGKAYDVVDGADDIRSAVAASADGGAGRPWIELALDRGTGLRGTLFVNPHAAGSIAIYD